MQCGNKKNAPVQRKQGPVLADAFIVQQQLVSENVEVPGSLIPMEETIIRPEVSGRVVRLNVNEGAVVNKGTVLVKLFDADLQTQLKKLDVQLQIAQKSEERQQELLKINGISQQDFDLTHLDVQNLKIDKEAIRIAISKTEIRAPYTGKLGLRHISMGAFISPSDVVTTIREVAQLKVEFSIPERYAKNIEKGYKVSFKVDGGSAVHEALVIATENSVNESTRTLTVRALVEEKHPELVPGIFARVNLQLGKDSTALMVPSQAILPQARNKQVVLYRKDSVEFKVVETGMRDSAFVQVTSGLKAGDTIIISGLMAIRPNSKVKLAKIEKYK